MKHYCASYKCDGFDQDWVATVKACVCVKNDTLAQMSDDLDPLLRKCSNLALLHEDLPNVENTYSEFQSFNRTHVRANESFTDPILMKKDDESYCIGPKWQTPTNYKELVKMNLFVFKQDTSEGGNSESSFMDYDLDIDWDKGFEEWNNGLYSESSVDWFDFEFEEFPKFEWPWGRK